MNEMAAIPDCQTFVRTPRFGDLFTENVTFPNKITFRYF